MMDAYNEIRRENKMKRKIMPFFMAIPLLASFFAFSMKSQEIKAAAVEPDWKEVAVEPSPGAYEYLHMFTPGNVTAFPNIFPTTPNNVQTIVTLNQSLISATNSYIGETGGIPNNYITLDPYAMIQGYHNLGRIFGIGIFFSKTMYTEANMMTELAGKLGLQLKVGKGNEFVNPEDNDSGPTVINTTDRMIGWDLTLKGREHPFFLDESKLDNVSNFNFIAVNTIYIESIRIAGNHFMEVTNHSSFRPAIEPYGSVDPIMFDINVDNRVDIAIDDFTVDNLDSTNPAPISAMEEFSIRYNQPYNQYGDFLSVDTMKVIVIDYTDTLLTITPISGPLTIKSDKKGWKTGVSAITYGGQDVMSLNESSFIVEFNSLGYGNAYFNLWNAYTTLSAIITNTGVTPATQSVGVTGDSIVGTIVSMMISGNDYLATDYYDMIVPDNSYSTFRLNANESYIELNPQNGSQGYVDSMIFTIDVVSVEPFIGADLANRFELVFLQADGSPIPETLRDFTLTSTSTQAVISYTHQSGYYGKTFSLTCKEIFDSRFHLKISVTGFEYYASVYTIEQEALTYAYSFDYLTASLQGASEDGVCEFDVNNNWTLLANEYQAMSTEAKALFTTNATEMKSSEIEYIIGIYQYIRSTNPSVYSDFMGLGSSPSPLPQVRQVIDVRIPLLIIVSLLSIGGYYYSYRKQKKII